MALASPMESVSSASENGAGGGGGGGGHHHQHHNNDNNNNNHHNARAASISWSNPQMWSMDWSDNNNTVAINDDNIGKFPSTDDGSGLSLAAPFGFPPPPPSTFDLEPLSPPSPSPASGSSAVDEVAAVVLPPHDQRMSIIDDYLRVVHPFLPLLHKNTLLSSLAEAYAGEPSRRGLLCAVLALGTNERRDEADKQSRQRWYDEAKRQYASTGHIPESPIETLQTAVCITFQAYLSTDSSTSWLVLGKAWKQVVALGYHRLDRKQAARLPGAPDLPTSWVERESIRRIVWMLYVLDRTICLPVGLDFTVLESQLGVSLPADESTFQGGARTEPPLNTKDLIPFDADVMRLAAAVRQRHHDRGVLNPFHHVILNMMMLSRSVSQSHVVLETEGDRVVAELENDLSELRMSLPRQMTNLSAAMSPDDLGCAIWVNVLLCLNTIFLMYSHVNLFGTDLSQDQWACCVATARGAVQLVRQATRTCIDPLLNPHITSSIFLCARILIIEQRAPLVLAPAALATPGAAASTPERETDRDLARALQRDIDVLKLLFDRLEELFYPLGRKFNNGMRFYQRQDPAFLHRIRNGRVGDLLAQCSSWSDDDSWSET